MSDDNYGNLSYSQIMGENPAHITLRLETKEPIEIGAFVGAFTSLAAEYDRFIKETNPDLKDDAQIFVKEVRKGSIEADLLPFLLGMGPLVTEMDKAIIVEEFVRRWGQRFMALLNGNKADLPNTKGELKDWMDGVQAIATDPNGSATIEAATYEDGKRQIRAAVKFDTRQARIAQETLENQKKELERRTSADYPRVLMVFTRSDVNNAQLGKTSGERVKIEEISPKPLALVYASDLAEQRIKHEIRDADENVYKKGFVVDVNVRLNNGRPAAYAVTNVHQVIDLDED
jgi:hypothetical protein